MMKKLYTRAFKQLFLFVFLLTSVAGWGQTTIFQYTGGGNAPTGWVFNNNVTTNVIEQPSYWLLDANSTTADNILTATYDLSAYTSAVFSFDFRNYGTPTNEIKGKIEVSYNGGTSYTQVATTNNTTSTYSSYSLTLSGVSDQVKIKISNNGNTNQSKGLRLQNLKLVASGSLINNTIATSGISGSPFCIGAAASVTVPFTSTGTFNTGNTFVAQFSDASGSFATPTIIGTYSGTSTGVDPSGSISAIIPAGTSAGTGYKIRVVSSAPVANGNEVAVIIQNPATITNQTTPTAAYCQGSTASPLSVTATGANTYQWYSNSVAGNTGGTLLTGATNASYTPLTNTAGTLYYYCVVSGSCGSAVTSAVSGAIVTTASPNAPSGSITATANCGFTTLNYTGADTANAYWQTTSTGVATTDVANNPYLVTTTGTRYLRIKNGTCWSAATPFAVSVATSANITGQPSSTSVVAPNAASFNVTATNATGGYQWQIYNTGSAAWENITGATSASYNTGATAVAMTGRRYRVIVKSTTPCDDVISSEAVLTVTAAPVPKKYELVTSADQLVAGKKYLIVSASSGSAKAMSSQNTSNRKTADVTVLSNFISVLPATTATGSEPFEFVLGGVSGNWSFFDPLTTAATSGGYLYASSSTANELKTQATNNDNGLWSVAINSSSYEATILAQGINSRNSLRFNSTLFNCYVNTNTTQPFAYLFVENNCVSPIDPQGNISGTSPACNSTVLSYTGSDKSNAYWVSSAVGKETTEPATSNKTVTLSGTYYLRIKVGDCWSDGSISKTVEVNTAPNITSQPTSQTLSAPNSTTFSVTASGGALSYQWQVSEDCGATWHSISGATASSYSIAPTSPSMNGNRYKVVVSNNCGSVTSVAAELRIVDISQCVNVDFTLEEGWIAKAYADTWSQNISGNIWNGRGVNVAPSNSRLQFRDTGDSFVELPVLNRPVKVEFNAQISSSDLGVNEILVQYYNSTNSIWETIENITVDKTSYVNKIIDLSTFSTNSNLLLRLHRAANSVTSRTIYIDNIIVNCSTIPEISTDYIWTGGANTTSWDDYCNWSPKGIPTEVDNVRFRNATGASNTLIVVDGRTVNNLIIDEAGVLNVGSTGNFTVKGSITYDNSLGATANFACASKFNIASTALQVIPPFNYGNLNTAGGDREVLSDAVVGVCGSFVSGTGTITMNNSTVHYNGDNQPINSNIQYYKVHFSGNGTKSPSGPLDIHTNGEVVISDNALVNYDSYNLGKLATNSTMLTMTGGRLVLGTTGLQPKLDGNYKLSGGIIEFSNKDTVTGSTIRNKQYINADNTGYQNIVVSGNTISNSSGIIGLNTNGTFIIKKDGIYTSKSPVAPIKGYDTSSTLTVENGGVFETAVPLGFYGALVGTNYPSVSDNVNVILSDGSTIAYTRLGDQTITNKQDYANLTVSGSGIKTAAAGAVVVNGLTKLTRDSAELLVPTPTGATPNVFYALGGIDNSNGTTGKFHLADNAQLIQHNAEKDSANNDKAVISADRYVTDMDNVLTGTDAQMDYVYWSSPVSGQKLRGNAAEGGFSPGTSWNRFFEYNEKTDYFVSTPDFNFMPAKGYAIRAETEAAGGIPVNATGYNKTYVFKGKPNNGGISIPIKRSANSGSVVHGYNLVGNPYPSNISFDTLYQNNAGLIYNTAWFWTNKFYQMVQNGSSYNGNNYAVYNGTGGNNAPTTANGAGEYPNGIVKVGQGFIVQARIAEGSSGNLLFENSYGTGKDLRVTTGGTFFQKGTSEKNRFWLRLVSPDDIVNTQLIGYIEGASDAYDQDYDAESFDLSSDLFFSKVQDKRLLIQGKGNFTVTDKVVLGANIFKDGNYTITLQQPEGIFAGSQEIYLKDHQLNTYTNLREGSYTFAANKGLSEGRFEIVYQKGTVLESTSSAKDDLWVYRDGEFAVVKSTLKKIDEIQIFDASGRLLQIVNPAAKETRIDLAAMPEGVYFLNIKRNGSVSVKKIVK